MSRYYIHCSLKRGLEKNINNKSCYSFISSYDKIMRKKNLTQYLNLENLVEMVNIL